MRTYRKWLILPLIALVIGSVYWFAPRLIPDGWFGFAYELPPAETALRQRLVDTACAWAGIREGDEDHRALIDRYNSLDPLPVDYRVTYEDAWCAAFGSVAAMDADLLDIIPAECSCNRQIRLFQEMGRWEEADNHLPLPGDYIFYDWDIPRSFDCTGGSDHVGIVVGTCGPFIRVMEGNKDDDAGYRTIWRNDWCIRGYGLPDYASKCQ